MSWRNSPKIAIHPAAEWFPLLPRDELEALAKDIKENYLREKVTVITEGGRQLVIDGRNRLDAIELAGFNVVDPQTDRLLKSVCSDWPKGKDRDPATVEAFIVSKNIHRRHLTADQKRDLIAKLLKAKPERSNLATAKIAHADDKTVATVRQDLEANSEIPNKTDRVEASGRKARGRKPAGKKSAAKEESAPAASVSAANDHPVARTEQTSAEKQPVEGVSETVKHMADWLDKLSPDERQEVWEIALLRHREFLELSTATIDAITWEGCTDLLRRAADYMRGMAEESENRRQADAVEELEEAIATCEEAANAAAD
jgi:hypothetical protein